jgi:GntR family transcriptional regulator
MAAGHGMGRRARIPGRPPEEEPLRFVPRYYEIEQALRARIAELQPDEPLPSDAMLCEEFGVSRMTARNAVQRLVQEGIVYRVPGRGTFVAEPPVHRQAGNLLSFTEEMRRRGRVPSSKVLTREIRAAGPSEASWLQLAADEAVIVLRRLRLADDEPVAIEQAVFPATTGLAPLLDSADLEHRSLHDTLVQADRIPTQGRARLGAESATPEDALLLNVPEGSALLVEKRVIHDQDGRPLELCESRYAGDRYGLDVQFDVELPGADGA